MAQPILPLDGLAETMRLQPSADAETTILRPETVVRRRPPLNLEEGDLSLFSHELERVIPPTHLLEFADVRVSAEGILFKGGEMLPVSFAFPANRRQWKRRSVVKFFVSNYLIKRRRRYEREAVWVIDDWSAGYFHWLADVLPRLLTIKDRLPGLVLLLPHRYKNLSFVEPSLKPFRVGEIEYIEPGEVLHCRKLIVPTQTAPSGHYNERLIRGVRELVNGCYLGRAPEGAAGERIYISRGGAPKRRISNEETVMRVVSEFGFEVLRAEAHSFEEQVRIAARARHLVSNHGAGLMNMLFMREGGSVLELRHRTDSVNNCYFTLASALGLDYFYQTCDPERPGEDPHTAHLLVDETALRANLCRLLGA